MEAPIRVVPAFEFCYHGAGRMGKISKIPDARLSGFEAAHQKLIEGLRKEIKDEGVLSAMARTPRELFVPPELRHLTYEDTPLSIGHEQTISQPYIVALMLQDLALRGQESVLEVGTGSGYQAVLLSQLARRVVSVERIPALAEKASKLIKTLGCANVRVEPAGEGLGCPSYAPFDAIIVAAAAPEIPEGLLDQLVLGGRMVIPVGSQEEQDLKSVVRGDDGPKTRSLGLCRFVPLIWEGGW